MHNHSKIHLAGRSELQLAGNPATISGDQVTDIVRETLTIARECDEALASSDLKKDRVLIDLVASLVIVRLRKAGAR
jgi:hypothetical protein